MATILDGAVSVSITTTGATPQLPNTTTPAFACYLPTAVATVFGSALTRSYISAAAWVTDGGAVTDAAYLWLSEVFAQNPALASAKIIRLTTAVTQTATFTVTDTVVGHTVGYFCVGTDGVAADMTTTATGNTTTDATTIAAKVDATGVGTTSALAVVTSLNAATKTQVYYQGIVGGTFIDNTPTASITTDLDNAIAQDNDWYGLSIAYQDRTNITAAAVWAETNKKMFSYTTTDTNNLTASTGIGATLKTAGYTYTFGMYSGTPITYGGTGLNVQLFVATPGSITLAWKTIPGTTADSSTAISPTALAALETNNLSYYLANISGVNTTFNKSGKMASGMYADLRYGIDNLRFQIQNNIFALLQGSPKVPMDPRGIAQVGQCVRSALQQYSASDTNPAALLRTDPGYMWTVTLSSVSAITTADRSARILRNVTFTAWAQNAIQTVYVTGTVSV